MTVHIYGHPWRGCFARKNFCRQPSIGRDDAAFAALNKKHYYSRTFPPPDDDLRTVSRPKGFLDHYHELIGTWTRKLRNRQQAEDLAHDAFVRVLESGQDEVEQPRAYLHQTARNIAVDGYRREDRRQSLEQQALDLSPSVDDDPEAYMSALQLADRIERALAELPLNCRKVFVWQKLEGLTQAEIAERMGLTKNMVEKYMIRTLRHLREHLDVSTR